MTKSRWIAPLITIGILLAGCSSADPASSPQGPESASASGMTMTCQQFSSSPTDIQDQLLRQVIQQLGAMAAGSATVNGVEEYCKTYPEDSLADAATHASDNARSNNTKTSNASVEPTDSNNRGPWTWDSSMPAGSLDPGQVVTMKQPANFSPKLTITKLGTTGTRAAVNVHVEGWVRQLHDGTGMAGLTIEWADGLWTHLNDSAQVVCPGNTGYVYMNNDFRIAHDFAAAGDYRVRADTLVCGKDAGVLAKRLTESVTVSPR